MENSYNYSELLKEVVAEPFKAWYKMDRRLKDRHDELWEMLDLDHSWECDDIGVLNSHIVFHFVDEDSWSSDNTIALHIPFDQVFDNKWVENYLLEKQERARKAEEIRKAKAAQEEAKIAEKLRETRYNQYLELKKEFEE